LGHIALLALGVAPTLALGQLPSPAFGLSGYVLVTPRGAFPLEVGIAYLPAVRARSEVGVGQADFELWLGSLALCPWRPSWPVAFDVCLGVEAGRLQVAADGFVTDNVRTRDPVLNLRVGVAFQLPLVGPLFARGSLHASVPLLQRNYTYRAEDNMSVSLFRMPQAALRAELGLGIAL
jgi:hypothetical protein